jgi:uncharacterized protein YprB with RNaseH-like and TPR domain
MQPGLSGDLQAQLELLRRRMASAAQRADERLAEIRARAALEEPLERFVKGQQVETQHGKHFESDRLWPHWQRHGSMEISRLQSLPGDLLREISGDAIPHAPPESWAFLDTETTGLAGGSGTCAFLVGVGRIRADGFHVKQFFLRDYPEEPSVLAALTESLADARVLVTYNGRTFDVPLLETRYRLARARPPFDRLTHLDLLHGARRLWRFRFESCRLVELENQILGHERENDIPGSLIPEIYFDFVRTGRAARLAPVFIHNQLDIVSLASLTGIVPWAFREAGCAELRHATEFMSLGRWIESAGHLERARDLYREAIRRHLRDDLLYRTMRDLAGIEKRLGAHDAAVALYSDLAAIRNEFRVEALEALAKHYEHRERNYAMALEFTEAAIAIEPGEALAKRRERLSKKKGQTLLRLG